MPTYDYQCDKCQKSFEAFQAMSDAALKICSKQLCRQKTWGKSASRQRKEPKRAGLSRSAP